MLASTLPLLAAIAATTTHADNLRTSSEESTGPHCPDACSDVYEPVTYENGITYLNECYKQAADCKDKKKDIGGTDPRSKSGDSSKGKSASGSTYGTPVSYCPDIICLDDPVDDEVIDENGVIYPSKCEMEVAKCKGPIEDPLKAYKRLYGKEFGASRQED
ncbi:Epi6-like protease inhibitor [Phytophthora palmivora]|uniref:Epi6-like protease inhibitor n=1 Tax=Phytophthora palmivora TaxID=4796 RepID=A0A2P4YQ08_9STRA|nr:Epi6-like protease inhibitor [Phytophthora palmivora]